MAPVIPAKRFPYHYTISHPPVKRAALRPQADPPRRSAPKGCAGTWVVPGVGSSRRRWASAHRHTLPGASRLTVVRWLGLCLESEAAEDERLKSPIARLRGVILRFG